jgi:DNA repair exonuclease SbcCD ATPase subunit
MSNIMTMYKIAGLQEKILHPLQVLKNRLLYGVKELPSVKTLKQDIRAAQNRIEKIEQDIQHYKGRVEQKITGPYGIKPEFIKDPYYRDLKIKENEIINNLQEAQARGDSKAVEYYNDQLSKIYMKIKNMRHLGPELDFAYSVEELAPKVLDKEELEHYQTLMNKLRSEQEILDTFKKELTKGPERVPILTGIKSVLQDPEARKGLYMVGGAGATMIGAPIGGYMYYKKKKEQQKPINRIKKVFGR